MAELYACGSKVRIPHLGLNASPSTGNRKEKQGRRRGGGERLQRSSRDAIITPRRGRLITELGDSLKFEDMVVSLHCPEARTYAQSLGDLNLLCNPRGKRYLDTKLKSHGLGLESRDMKALSRDQGRCGARGEGSRHMPCHLLTDHIEDIVRRSPPPPLSSRYRVAPVTKTSQTSSALPRESLGINWEERVFEGVSKATADNLRKSKKGVKIMMEKEEDIKREDIEKEVFDKISTNEEYIPPRHSYLTELATGAVPVHIRGSDNTILLSNKTAFKKVLQTRYPKEPAEFLGETSKDDDGIVESHKPVIGYRRWLALPIQICTSSKAQWSMADTDSDSAPHYEKKKEIGRFEDIPETNPKRLVRVAKELLEKWEVHTQKEDQTHQYIRISLKTVSPSIQVYGLGVTVEIIIKKLLQVHKKESAIIMTSRKSREDDDNELLPDDILEQVHELMKSDTVRVRVLSAIIILTCTEEEEEEENNNNNNNNNNNRIKEAIDVLQLCIEECSTTSCEYWVSIQSLAIKGISTPQVIRGLMRGANSNIPGVVETSTVLLSQLSRNTNLVNAMLLEQLNSKSCKERYSTCKLLPELSGGINKDVCNRLVTISWDDWSTDVRVAAAQALGRTGQAKLIHDEIERRLKIKTESVRLDALKKIQTLHLMTARLVPAFVDTFNDDHISVKLQAIAVAESLMLTDAEVIKGLAGLMEDHSWKVKAHAIRAIGTLKADRPELLSHLLWAVRFERLPQVRAEACNALKLLGVKNDKVAKSLRDILIVEDNQLVINQARLALIHLGYTPTADDEMSESVCAEVKRLGSQSAITEHILSLQEQEMIQYMLHRPTGSLSTRDYLNDDIRQKHFLTSRVHPPHSLLGVGGARVWSPDRDGIDEELEIIKRRCQLDPDNILRD